MLLVLQRVWVPVCSQGPGQTSPSNTLPSAVHPDPPPVFPVLEPQRGAPSAPVMDLTYYAPIQGQTGGCEGHTVLRGRHPHVTDKSRRLRGSLTNEATQVAEELGSEPRPYLQSFQLRTETQLTTIS